MIVWNIMIGEKKMSKRKIGYINGNKKNSKAMANAKQQEIVDVKWEATPTWTVFNMTPETPKNDYKLFTEEGNQGKEDYDKES